MIYKDKNSFIKIKMFSKSNFPLSPVMILPSFAGISGKPLVYYVGAASGGIWKTVDGGLNWKPVFDDGANWQSFFNDQPSPYTYVPDVQEHFNDLVAGTYGRGIQPN